MALTILVAICAFAISGILAVASTFPNRMLRMASSAVGNRVVVCGGGFGGLYTAIATKNKFPNVDVTLVDPKDKFVFLPLLYELATGSASIQEVAPSYEELLKGTNINFVQDSVCGVDVENRTVRLRNTPDLMSYDQLVLAVGCEPRINLVPGAAEHAIPFYRIEDAYVLQTKLRAFLADKSKSVIRIAVVGGGKKELFVNILKNSLLFE